ncbi:hypothetical protein, partial [Haemophilus influenzae]|uniref:hypothetical protein n=1 Tax=Haemophilus influenzae TaxID=727 RepID=UPI0011B02303
LDNQANSEKGSLVSATNRLVLNVEKLDNQNTKVTQSSLIQGIRSADLTVNTSLIENQFGGIYAGQSVNLTVNQSINNRQGEILSAGRVDIINPDLTLVVNN